MAPRSLVLLSTVAAALGADLTAPTCEHPGRCADPVLVGRDAEADEASLLQVGKSDWTWGRQHVIVPEVPVKEEPETRFAVEGEPFDEGEDSGPRGSHRGDLVGIDDFVRYPGYTGRFEISGKMWIRTYKAGRQVLKYRLHGVDPACSTGPGSAPNSCGIRLHKGRSCESDVGPHLYDRDARASDPWSATAFTAVPGVGVMSAGGKGQPVDTGLDRSEVRARTVVVYDFSGKPVACAVTHGFYSGNPPETQYLRSVGVQHFAGGSVGGSVTLADKPGPTASASGVYLSFSLSNVDPACSKGPGAAPLSCGVHLSTSKFCGPATAQPLFDATAVLMDPWRSAGYTADQNRGKTVAEANHLPIHTGMGVDGLVGYALVVHDFHGKVMGCGVVA